MHSRNFRAFLKSLFLMQIFLLILVIGLSFDINSSLFLKVPRWDMGNILQGLSNINLNNDRAARLFKGVNVVLAGENNSGFFSPTYFRVEMPEDLLRSHIQALAYAERNTNISRGEDPPIVEEKYTRPEIMREESKIDQEANYSEVFKDAKVVFYCTHNAETYIPDSGKARLDGHKGLINNVTEHLANILNEKGLHADFIDTIHDYPVYNESYTRSRETVSKILNSDEKILALFDLHRDSIPGMEDAPTIRIKNKDSAKILIIIGTDERKAHPRWRENMKFAQKIYARGEKLYPGLITGIRTKAGTYNQEFHDHALLLEIGRDYNSLAEAQYAVELFSEILIEVLKEEVE